MICLAGRYANYHQQSKNSNNYNVQEEYSSLELGSLEMSEDVERDWYR